MNWIYINVLLSGVALILNAIGVWTLAKLRHKYISQNQKVLAITLCSIELCTCAIVIARCFTLMFAVEVLRAVFILFHIVTLALMYTFVMFLVTVERYLLIKLNIKYAIYITAKKIKITLCGAFVVFTVAFLILLTLYIHLEHDIEGFFVVYIYPIFEFFFIAAVFLTYYAIFKKYKGNDQRLKRLRYHVCDNTYSFNRCALRSKGFDFYIPSLIIVTFTLFTIVPNMFRRLVLLWKDAPWAFSLNSLVFPFGWFFDPLIYIFSIRTIKRRVQQKASTILSKFK